MSLTNRILLAMVAGIALGSLIEWWVGMLDPGSELSGFLQDVLILGVFDVVGRVFIASLKLLVVPLVMVSLICGMSSLGTSSRMGSIAGRTIGLYLFTTGVAVSLGLTAALLIGPGKGVEAMAAASFEPKPAPALTDTLVNIFPSNPFKAMADGQMLQVIVFALLVGFALTRSGEAGERIANWFRDMEVIVMKMVGLLIELAPYGVFALLTKLFATMGFGTIVDLAAYFFTLLGVLLFHGLVVYTSLLKVMTSLSPAILLQKMRRVWAFAFSTASSGATLPITLRTVEAAWCEQERSGIFYPAGGDHKYGWHGHHAGCGNGVYCSGLWHRSHQRSDFDGGAHGHTGVDRDRGGAGCGFDYACAGFAAGRVTGGGGCTDYRRGSLPRHGAHHGECDR